MNMIASPVSLFDILDKNVEEKKERCFYFIVETRIFAKY